MIRTQNECPQCGKLIPLDAPGGMCPHCILDIGMRADGTEMTTPPTEARTSQPGGLFTAPSIAELQCVFPDLEILELVGQGGMGAVYKVRQKSLDRVAALKILPSNVDGDPKFAERFTREARALAKLTHPNIVMIFEFGEAGAYHYFLMEFVDGVNLRETLSEGKITPEQALAIVPQICDALQFAHEEGIVHRDIKPENVLIDRRGRVRIADFGLAKLLRKADDSHTLTGTRQIMGTPHYMAPEQMEKPLTVDHRADIYSLGVVFYELLTGELPIGRFDPPSSRATLNSRLDDVVLRTLQKEPSRRYQQASELKTAVSSIGDAKPPRNAAPIEPGPIPQTSKPNDEPFSFFVPFYIEDEWGMSNHYGILSFDGEEVRVEFQKKASGLAKLIQGDMKEVVVPLSDIAECRAKSFLSYRKIHVLTRNMELLKSVPAANAGRILMKTNADDEEAADRLVQAVQLRQQGMPWPEVVHTVKGMPRELLHPFANEPYDEEMVQRRLNGPAWGMIGLGLLNFIAAGLLGIVLWSIVGELPEWLQWVDKVAPISDKVSDQPEALAVIAVIAISLTVGFLQFFSAFAIMKRQAWPLSLAVGIASMVPIHVGVIAGVPIGIWVVSAISHRQIRASYYSTKYAQEMMTSYRWERTSTAKSAKKPI